MAVFVGCSSAPEGNEQALRETITREWNAKVNKDWGVVYDLTADAYQGKMDRDLFVQKANVNVKEFSIKEVQITEPGRKALAVVDYSHSHKGFDFKTTSREKWVWENGGWHLDLDADLLPQ